MWVGFWSDIFVEREISKDDLSEADLNNGGKLLPSDAGKFKRKKPRIEPTK